MNDLYLRAARREPVERSPIWIMRQAGRYLPEYRAVRQEVDFLTLCRTPELAAKVTLQPIERFGFDAAILFSDILVIAEPLGIDVAFSPGPVIERPLRTAADIERLRHDDPRESLAYVMEAIRILRGELKVPLIGFAGAPFTLAAYMVEGKGSKNFATLRSLMIADSPLAHRLLERITETLEVYLLAQVDAGAQAIQLFDTWAGLLAPGEFGEFCIPYVKRLIEKVRERGVPVTYFAMDGCHLLERLPEVGADVLGIDWRTPLSMASTRVGRRHALQGNLDPTALFAPPAAVRERTTAVLEEARDLPGHIFNLGHGILPDTPIESVEAVVETVRATAERS
ncbi:MAG: uroporphyrinogen decarboxylase [Acidobacteriota bacterium]|nr:uroporphyrinogen decarboxylase [Acidobacteriota bacterium]MDH3784687.1 uroporphyrinogen decarboxylase [Acidobacteriota bacterium]